MNRRNFLLSFAGIALGGHANAIIQSNPYALVYLRRGDDQGWVHLDTAAGYQSFRYALRDVKTGKIGYPPRVLGNILSWMQSYLRLCGHEAPIVVTSGLRSPATNYKTEGAARDSLHLPDAAGVFKAVDIKIPGIPGEYVGRLAAFARQGGVGFYGDGGHTHIDTGSVRYWRKAINPPPH